MTGFTFRGNVNPTAAMNKLRGYDSDPDLYQIALKNGYWESLIRFLPSIEPEIPEGYIEVGTHTFKDSNGREHRHLCLKTIGQKCPICQYIKPLWDAGLKEEYRAYKPYQQATANIGVLQSSLAPDTVGKVFLFSFGWQIKEKIIRAITPPEGSSAKPFMPFDYFGGANFKLIVTKKGENNNYESSLFEAPNPLTEQQAKIFDDQLKPLLPRFQERTKNVKSYEELASLFYQATGKICPDWSPSSSMVVNQQAPAQGAQATFQQPQAPMNIQFSQPQAPAVPPAQTVPAQADPQPQAQQQAPVAQPQAHPQAQQPTPPVAQAQGTDQPKVDSTAFWGNFKG